MKVVFRADASLAMGTGHVMRCLALAQALKDNKVNVEFICRKHKGSLIDKIRSNRLNVHELEVLEEADDKLAHSHWLGATQQQDADDCIEILKSEKIDWLIVDHYALDEQWQKKLKPYYEKLMVIDDLADRKHQCDILLDQNFGRSLQDYKELVPTSSKLLMGSKYALLRPEFEKYRQYSLNRRKNEKFKKLLVNMGGTDTDNITGKVIERLQIAKLPKDVEITIVMGKTAPHLSNIITSVNKLPYGSEVKVDVDNMAELMANADIAIGASGATTWERCCLGLPTIQLVTAHNQEFIASKLNKINAIKLVEIDDVVENLENFQYWMKSTGESASKVTNGSGIKSVLECLV
ncbi:MAG: UDP-2,4-diacetamido-2,4,6-trideoxy-beta-L-altropyranose hydrolase [Lentimicrobiaceae bacterium]|nr:UDP-2,4-diacetamido-2,4,6-trideoxy-beta-L-altropyranose hydrolase [Candidatus Ruthturnera sp.]MBT6673545.1 UDP-2,4-diacetamido-2,4,6-trideoxy-beta-L-altropyranose hydrolase [Lentimicrobiaceae bacterium]